MARPQTAWQLVASLAVLACLYVAMAFVLGRQLPMRASVEGVDIGGMSASAARARLADHVDELEGAPVEVALGPVGRTLAPDRSGLSVDLDATLAGQTGFSLDPRRVWFRLTGGGPIPARGDVDVGDLTAAVAELAAGVDRPLVEAAVSFAGGKVDVVRSRSGLAVDVPGTVEAVATTWPARRVEGVVAVTEPAVAPEKVDAAVEAVADRAVAGPLRLVVGRRTADLPPARFAPALGMVAQDGDLVLRVDPARIAAIARGTFTRFERAPVETALRVSGSGVAVVPGTPGVALSEAVTARHVEAALRRLGPGRRAAVALQPRPPTHTPADVAAWGVSAPLASVDVPGGDAAQAPNVAAALRAIDGRVLPPASSFSLASALGERTAERGYVLAPTALSGREVGGGVDRVASALFEAAYRAGASLPSRAAHPSLPAGAREGLDAALGTPAPDLVVTNDTGGGLLIQAVGGRVVVWGKPGTTVAVQVGPRRDVLPAGAVVDPMPGCVVRPGSDGFAVDVVRTLTRGGAQLRREVLTSTYAPRDAVTCVSPEPSPPAVAPSPVPTPPPDPTPAASPAPGTGA